MDKIQDVLLKFGTWAASNKYLSSIKDAFQGCMSFTIIGAVGILWSNVIVNNTTGLGAFFEPIMALEFLNPAFNALNFATISCITVFITFLLGSELGEKNGIDANFCGILGLTSLLTVSKSTHNFIVDGNVVESVSGIFADTLGATGLFTGMIIAIVAVEMFTTLYKIDALKIKLPEQVPPQISRSFEYLVPGLIVMAVISIAGVLVQNVTGMYVNDLIFNFVQTPLLSIGGSLPGMLVFCFIAGAFWTVGLHGDNMISGVFQPIVFAQIAANQDAVLAGLQPENIVNWSWYRIFSCTGGTGMALGLALAILFIGKRDDNRSIATLSLAPNMFNIMEVEAFGLPIVLNPLLCVPFILAPLVTLVFGYFATAVGFCPIMYLNGPWTMPPFLYGFVCSGGDIMGGITQLIAVVIATVIYIPFIKMYEKQQNTLEGNV